MRKWNGHTLNVNGMQINSDGSPNTRALAGKLNQLTVQMDELAGDIDWIKDALNKIIHNTTHLVHAPSAASVVARAVAKK